MLDAKDRKQISLRIYSLVEGSIDQYMYTTKCIAVVYVLW